MWLFAATTFRFYLINFQLNTDFPSRFCVFYRKITKRYSKIGFSRKCFWKEQKTVTFFFPPPFCFLLKTIFYSRPNWKPCQVLKIVKFEFKVTVHSSLWTKCTQLWPINCVYFLRIILYIYKPWTALFLLPTMIWTTCRH